MIKLTGIAIFGFALIVTATTVTRSSGETSDAQTMVSTADDLPVGLCDYPLGSLPYQEMLFDDYPSMSGDRRVGWFK